MSVWLSESPRRGTLAAVALMLLCASAVALMPNFAKLALLDGSNPNSIVVIRSITAVLILGAAILIRRGGFGLPSSLIATAAVASLSAALMNYCFLTSLLSLDISLAILIIFSHPFLIAFYYHFRGQSRLSPFRMASAFLAFAGLAMALAVNFDGISQAGVAYAVAASIFATIMVISMIRVSERVGGVATNFHLAFWSLCLFTIVLMFTRDWAPPQTGIGWIGGVGNGLVSIVAYISFLAAARLIGPSRASLLSFLEPLATILLAALLFGERLNLTQWAGVVFILIGLFFMEARLNPGREKT